MPLRKSLRKRSLESSITRYLGLDFSALPAEDGAPRYARWSSYGAVSIDGEALAGLMVGRGVGASTERSYEIRRVDSDHSSEA